MNELKAIDTNIKAILKLLKIFRGSNVESQLVKRFNKLVDSRNELIIKNY